MCHGILINSVSRQKRGSFLRVCVKIRVASRRWVSVRATHVAKLGADSAKRATPSIPQQKSNGSRIEISGRFRNCAFLAHFEWDARCIFANKAALPDSLCNFTAVRATEDTGKCSVAAKTSPFRGSYILGPKIADESGSDRAQAIIWYVIHKLHSNKYSNFFQRCEWLRSCVVTLPRYRRLKRCKQRQ